MVLQKAVKNLKEQPKDDRKAVAGGIALAVVVILFCGWAFLFIRHLKNSSGGQLGGTSQDQFDFSSVRDAQQELMTNYSGASANQAELQAVRDAAASQNQQISVTQPQSDQNAPDPFSQQTQ